MVCEGAISHLLPKTRKNSKKEENERRKKEANYRGT